MEYTVTFLEGLVSFISPCILPMLPIYISYFAGKSQSRARAFARSVAFVLGFTCVFCLLGFFAGSIGGLLHSYHTAVDIVCGIVIILLGLHFLGVIKLPFFRGFGASPKVSGVFSSFAFGGVFSLAHLPCIGAFLGSALMSASASGSAGKGFYMLLSYSIGMGVPFLVSALLIQKLSPLFDKIRNNYKFINPICGVLLILLGFLMASGLLHSFLHIALPH